MLNFLTQAIIERTEFEIENGHQPKNAFMFVESGSFSCRFDGCDAFTASEGDLVVFPLASHFTRHVLTTCRLHLIYFEIDRQCPLSQYFPEGLIPFKNRDRVNADRIVLRHQMKYRDSLSQEICSHYLDDIFMTYLKDASLISSRHILSVSMLAVIDYMNQHMDGGIVLEQLAVAASMSKNGLCKRFHSETGFTPMQYFTRLRMQRALRLLQTTRDSIGSIAASCGYENIYYFSNSFKKAFGLSPSNYRSTLPKA